MKEYVVELGLLCALAALEFAAGVLFGQASENPVRPYWSLLARLVVGLLSYGLGVLFAYRSKFGRDRRQLCIAIALSFIGSALLVGIRWPR